MIVRSDVLELLERVERVTWELYRTGNELAQLAAKVEELAADELLPACGVER